MIPEIGLTVVIDLVPGTLVIIIDEPLIYESPLDGIIPLDGNINQEPFIENWDRIYLRVIVGTFISRMKNLIILTDS